jgi:hypothetical protein
MSLVAIHPDSASIEYHMEIGGSRFRAFAGLIRMRSIEVFGRPEEKVMKQIQQKAQDLGGATVIVHALSAGFTR